MISTLTRLYAVFNPDMLKYFSNLMPFNYEEHDFDDFV